MTNVLLLFCEARVDPKVTSLPDDQYRVWINLLLWAADQPEAAERGSFRWDDYLPDQVARGDADLLERTLAALMAREIVVMERPGEFFFRRFADRFELGRDLLVDGVIVEQPAPARRPNRSPESVERRREAARLGMRDLRRRRAAEGSSGEPALATGGDVSHDVSHVSHGSGGGRGAGRGDIGGIGGGMAGGAVSGRRQDPDRSYYSQERTTTTDARVPASRLARTSEEIAVVATLVTRRGMAPDRGDATTRYVRETISMYPLADPLHVTRAYVRAELKTAPALRYWRQWMKNEHDRVAANTAPPAALDDDETTAYRGGALSFEEED